MALYYSKEGLYREISNLKKFLGFENTDYGFNLVRLLIKSGFLLDFVPFKTRGLRGMAILGHEDIDDVILLNNKRDPIEQNFDCGHELIHLALHRNIGQKTFNCFDKVQAQQNPFVEWQANEGAAEFFVPYQVFIPMIGECHHLLNSHSTIERFKSEMAEMFHVPEAVIKFRIENLKYETEQYLSGIPLNDIEILSSRKQKERDIQIVSLNQISDMDFMRRMTVWNESFIS